MFNLKYAGIALCVLILLCGVVVFIWWFQRLLIERENCRISLEAQNAAIKAQEIETKAYVQDLYKRTQEIKARYELPYLKLSQENTIQYKTTKHPTTQHHKIKYHTTPHNTIQHNTMPYHAIQPAQSIAQEVLRPVHCPIAQEELLNIQRDLEVFKRGGL
ncbi:hypothetical protein HBZC1_17580 [Helicobacter bizzozeronii CIII-1]|uniref:Uncharacterized protein n=1 Tax=Helicobacter bizzozeronii (strain CIII-1) TaxID=1002804 RepID=F8KPL9_HELBC|nr:hypothetical protein [Helicobacter bizzozeronii]CCB80744.1 hypothetical protein HBZC1_17580 [Helicobacter bizzozeronii CIII-1]